MLGICLLAMTLSNQSLALVATGSSAAALLGALIFRKDGEIENRRRNAMKVSSLLEKHGLVEVPKILTAYAIGDYSGLATLLRDVGERLTNPAQIEVEFAQVFQNLLEAKLADPQQRSVFLEEVNKRAAVYLPTLAPAAA